ncbi:hypothetical protein BW247_10555 [Acidihalobacter ferrooxydans]|uniref:Glycosyltransferase 2-like domain-containing protein n=2 Tax=Acidihalobacter ferrooxydans TaxID=1765967 RepID=A0A1P8UI51_9GAMM|nr:hypothetical protein BW247_10555 [Acidihalobacter ferrooxydans]
MISKQKMVTSIILNYNKSEETIKLYRQLAAQTCPSHEILVVDNCSDIDQQEKLLAFLPENKIIKSKINGGFSYGMNLGISSCLRENQCDYVWILNNDLKIPGDDVLEEVVSYLEEHPDIAMATPLLYEPDSDEVSFSGGYIDNNGWMHSAYDYAQFKEMEKTHPNRIWLDGTALVIKRELIEHIGLLDETYFMYWEDIDFSYRVNLSGYTAKVVANVGVYHCSPQWSERPIYWHYYNARNELLFMRNRCHASWKTIMWAVERRLNDNLDQLLRHGFYDRADAVYRGIWDGLIGKTGKAEDFSAPPRIVKMLGRLLSWYGARQRVRRQG